MIDIWGGTFIMGNNNQPPMSNDQDPEHSVTVDDFKMGKTEVSNGYYTIFLNDMMSIGNLCDFRHDPTSSGLILPSSSSLPLQRCAILVKKGMIFY